jgi:hypothetical protein
MIAFRKNPNSPKLVEIVMFASGREDHVSEVEWDERYPLPPESTRLLGLTNNHNCPSLIARHNITGELYFMSHSQDNGYQWKPESF